MPKQSAEGTRRLDKKMCIPLEYLVIKEKNESSVKLVSDECSIKMFLSLVVFEILLSSKINGLYRVENVSANVGCAQQLVNKRVNHASAYTLVVAVYVSI